MTVVKQKILNGVVCTGACLCLRTMLAFLCFMNVDPQKLLTWHFLIHVVTNLERNVMHRFKRLTMKIQQGGVALRGS
jgi:hypothetical protein